MDGMQMGPASVSPEATPEVSAYPASTGKGNSTAEKEESVQTPTVALDESVLSIHDLREDDSLSLEEVGMENDNNNDVTADMEDLCEENKVTAAANLIEDHHESESPMHAALISGNGDGISEIMHINALRPEASIAPLTKCVRKRRRRRIFSANPANTIAYRTRTVTKAKLANTNEESGEVQENSKVVRLPQRSVQHKAKTFAADAVNYSPDVPDPDARSSRKRSTKKFAVDPPDQTKKDRLIDLDRPSSILNQVNIKAILSKQTFDLLPSLHQYKLLKLLPDVDAVTGPDNVATPRSSAFNNEFFAKACEEWKTRLIAGEFIPEQMQKSRQETEKDKCKLDPWKMKYFEPVWGMKTTAPANPSSQKTVSGDSALPTLKPSADLPDKTQVSPGATAAPVTQEPSRASQRIKLNEAATGRGKGSRLPEDPVRPLDEESKNQQNGEVETLRSPSRSNKRISQDFSRDDQLQDKQRRLSVEPGDLITDTESNELKGKRSGELSCAASSDSSSTIDWIQRDGDMVTNLTNSPAMLQSDFTAKQSKGKNRLVQIESENETDSLNNLSMEPAGENAPKQSVGVNKVENVATVYGEKEIRVEKQQPSKNERPTSDAEHLTSSTEIDSSATLNKAQAKSPTRNHERMQTATAGQPSTSECLVDTDSSATDNVKQEPLEFVDQTRKMSQTNQLSVAMEQEVVENKGEMFVVVASEGVSTTAQALEDVKNYSPMTMPPLDCASKQEGDDSRQELASDDIKIMSYESLNPQAQAPSRSEVEVKSTLQSTSSDTQPRSDSSSPAQPNHNQMGINRKARPKAKQGKLARTPSAPPGSVNLERSYQICQAVIQNSPNREHLQNQLVKPPPVLVNSNVDMALHQQQHGLSSQLSTTAPQRRGSTPALVQATQLQPHVQLLRPHQKLILTHISGPPATKQLGISAHPVMAHPQMTGHPGGQLSTISALPILKPVQSSGPVVLQSTQVKPILQSQQHGQMASTSRFESPPPATSQPTHEGLRQQYIIVQATGSNGLPTNLAVPTNSLVLSSPVILDQKRSHSNESPNTNSMNSNSVVDQQSQPGNFPISLDGSSCQTITLPTASLPGGLGNVIDHSKPTHSHPSMEQQLGTEVKVLYVSAASNEGHGMTCVQTSAPSQGQYILNSFMSSMGTTHYKTTGPSNALKGSSLVPVSMSAQLSRSPSLHPANSMNNLNSTPNIIHVQSPAILNQQIGNRIVNIGLKTSQNTWNAGIVNINMNSAPPSVPDTTQDGAPSNALHSVGVLQTSGGPTEPLNVKVVHFGGNGKIVNSLPPKGSTRQDGSSASRMGHLVLDKKGNCICDLRAMVMCRKCGVFCHDDCMGATNLCVTCMIR